ncbi:MAG TPA: thioredoxin-disulfide reductase [Thermoleophilaceae bacterium]|nr:thioredoxin-disulfide reductase [Thermoleophilaceae bacterium]
MVNTAKDIENVVIVGSGPAGYTAALYTSRADLEPLVIEGFQWGGLLQQTTDVENYPGYPEGVMGPEMMQQFRDQAERFGTRFITDDATRVELSKEGGIHRVYIDDREILAKTVILAMGAEPKKLGVPGEDELAARGVSYCATCDAAFFRDKPTIVVGGGDTAMEDATFLSKFASKVGIVHRRPDFRASAIMLDRAKAIDNIELITPYVVQRFEPDGDGSLGKAVLKSRADGSTKELDIEGAFVAIGHRPNSDLVKGQVLLDDNGYVMTGGAAFMGARTPAEDRSTRTNVPGVFAAGDLVDHTYRQAVTAAGSGCMAALDAEWYLRDTPPDPEAHWAAQEAAASSS